MNATVVTCKCRLINNTEQRVGEGWVVNVGSVSVALVASVRYLLKFVQCKLSCYLQIMGFSERAWWLARLGFTLRTQF